MDLEEIISKYNGIGEWTKKIEEVTRKATAWQNTFGEGLDLIYPLSKKVISIPTTSTSRSILIAHRLWIYEYDHKREIGMMPHDVDFLYQYKDGIVKNVKNEKQDALRELIVLGKKANKMEDDREIEKEVDINIFLLREVNEGLSSLISQEQRQIKKISVIFKQKGYVHFKCIDVNGEKYEMYPTHLRNIAAIFVVAQIAEIFGEICRDYYEEVKGYVEPNIKIAQQMEDAVVQFKMARKLSQ